MRGMAEQGRAVTGRHTAAWILLGVTCSLSIVLIFWAVGAGSLSPSTRILFATSAIVIVFAIVILAALTLKRAVSERERAEAEIAESEQRFRMTFEQAAVGIAHVAPDGRWLRVNRKLCEIVGYTQEELLKKTFQDITHPEDLDADLALVKQVLAGEIETYSMEKRYFRTDCSIVWINLTVSLVRAPDGSPKYFISVIEDIGERKRATELMHKYAGELVRSNNELQEFAFVASHDLQEPLRKIVAFGRQLQDSAAGSLDSQSHEALSRIIGAATRMSRLIEGVLDLSRVATQAGAFEAINIRVPVMDALQDLDGRIQETGAAIDVGELPVVEADRLQMKRLFTNLLSNALKFACSDTAPHIRITSEGPTDGLYRISVIDNGIGFDQRYAEKVFTPFQRLHGPLKYEGSGMGLAICRKIVSRHGGNITAMSKPGEGSKFTISLPVRQTDTERRR